jgi:hypothetical protein
MYIPMKNWKKTKMKSCHKMLTLEAVRDFDSSTISFKNLSVNNPK